jgi:hypothetical protein
LARNLKVLKIDENLHYLAQVLWRKSLYQRPANFFSEKLIQWLQKQLANVLYYFPWDERIPTFRKVSSITSACWKWSSEKK